MAAVLLSPALWLPVASAQTVADVEARDNLIANQENLLNTYRCLFGVDTEVVPGGCPNPNTVTPGVSPANPTPQDIEVRDGLIQNQEALLNVYRCRFDVDTQIVPDGCIDGVPAPTTSDPTTTPEPATTPGPVATPEPAPILDVTAGRTHSCAIGADQTISCWGDNKFGQTNAPAGAFTSVSAGWEHTCGLRSDQTPVCWGDKRLGKSIAPRGEFNAVDAGGSHSCGIRSSGRVVCWGENVQRQSTPPSGAFTHVSAGGQHTCGIKTDQSVACWGHNPNGQTNAPSGKFTHVSAGWMHTCAIKTDRTVTCWGLNDNLQSDSPGGQFTHISADDFHSCGVRVDQTIACWGSSSHGQSGPPFALFVDVAAGWSHTCGVTIGGNIYCWGANSEGQTDAPNRGETLAELLAVRTELIYRNDPAGLIAFVDIDRAYTMGTDTWVVWACDTEAGTLENDPVEMAERFTSWVQPYFSWLSGGSYRVEFISGGTVKADKEQECYDNIRNTPSPQEANGAVIVVDLAMIDCGTEADCRIGGGGPGHCFDRHLDEWIPKVCSPHWPENFREIRLSTLGFTSVSGHIPDPPTGFVIGHELGHALSWPHSYDRPDRHFGSNLMDVMGNGQSLAFGTPAINRYAAGWIALDEVAIHPQPVDSSSQQQEAVYELYPLGEPGTQMLVLQTGAKGTFYTLGAREKSGFDGDIPVEGVEVYFIDQSAWCEDHFWNSPFLGTCYGPGRLTDVYKEPGRRLRPVGYLLPHGAVITGDARHVYSVGESAVIGNAQVQITGRTADGAGYVVKVTARP